MRQGGAEALVPEEPDDRMGHVWLCGGLGWVTAEPTRNQLLTSSLPPMLGEGHRLSTTRREQPNVGITRH